MATKKNATKKKVTKKKTVKKKAARTKKEKVVITLTAHEHSDGRVTLSGGFNPNQEKVNPLSYDLAIFSIMRELSNKAIEVRQQR
jgi:hypothetical protein